MLRAHCLRVESESIPAGDAFGLERGVTENDRPLILGNSSALMAYERLLNRAWTSARHAVLSGRAETNAQNVGDPGEHSLTTRPMLFGAALLLVALQALAHHTGAIFDNQK